MKDKIPHVFLFKEKNLHVVYNLLIYMQNIRQKTYSIKNY